MNSLINDIEALTTIKSTTLDKMVSLSEDSIAHCVLENFVEGKSTTTIDIGIGLLYIKLSEEGIHYKFIPSKNLEENVTLALKSKSSPLQKRVDQALCDKIENTYKQLL